MVENAFNHIIEYHNWDKNYNQFVSQLETDGILS